MRPHGLPAPGCEIGYPEEQVRWLLGCDIAAFWRFMNGQGQAICEGRRFDHERSVWVPSDCAHAHGAVAFPCDLERFMERHGLRVVVPVPLRGGTLASALGLQRR